MYKDGYDFTELNIDIDKKCFDNVAVKQNTDIGFILHLFSTELPISLTGCTVTVNYLNANSTVANVAGNCISIKDNTVTIKFPRDCTRSAGDACTEIVITKEGKQVATFPIAIRVNKGVIQGQQASKNTATLVEQLNNASSTVSEEITKLNNAINTVETNVKDIENKYPTSSQLYQQVNTNTNDLENVNNNLDTLDKLSKGVYQNVIKFTQQATLADGTIGYQILIAYKCGDDKDNFIEFDKCGVNKLFAMHKIYEAENNLLTVNPDIDRTKTLLKSFGTDLIGPYVVHCDNSTYDTGYTTEDFTGGWHGYNGDATGARTAVNSALMIYVDGARMRTDKGDWIKFSNRIDIKVINQIQAYNTKKNDGSGKNVLEETVIYTIEGNSITVNVSIKALEICTIKKYYGLQLPTSVLWNTSITYPNSADYKTRMLLSENPNSGNKSSNNLVNRFVAKGDKGACIGYIDNSYGLGNRQYVLDTSPNIFSMTYGGSTKIYHNLINGSNLTLTKGKIVNWRGGYIFTPDTHNTNVCDVFLSYKSLGKDKIIFDALGSVGKTLTTEPTYVSKKIKVVSNTCGAEIQDVVEPVGIVLVATKYGSIELEIE